MNEHQPDSLVEVELIELCQSIVADGKVELEEIKSLRHWLRHHRGSGLPAVAYLVELVERMAADGQITRQEVEELTGALHNVLGAQQSTANAIEVACNACGQRYTTQAQPAEQQLTCPACQAIIVVPAIVQAAEAPPVVATPVGESPFSSSPASSIDVPLVAPGTAFDEEAFKKSLVYQVNAPAEAVLADMNYLRQMDDEQEKQARKWKNIGLCGLIGLVIGGGIFALVAAEIAPPAVIVLAGIAGLAGVITLITGFVVASIHGRLDIDDKRYEMVAGTLRLLSKDMAADAPIAVKLDFRPHNASPKLQRTGPVGYWNVKFFVDGWLEMRGRFLDGTKFSVSVIEKQQDRHRTKISASGKTKHKYKTKNSSEAIVRLKIKGKRYPQAQVLYQRMNEVLQLPRWVQLKSVQAQGDLLTLRTTTSLPWTANTPGVRSNGNDGVNWVAMKFLSMYRLLNSAK